MPMTLAAALAIVAADLGDEQGLVRTGPEIVAMAGRWLYAAHPWRLRVRTQTIDGVQNQPTAPMPADFGELVRVHGPAVVVDRERLEDARWNNTPGTGSLRWVALAAGTFELWPTPTADGPLFAVSYRQQWATPANAGDALPIDDHAEPVFVAALQACSRSVQQRDTEPVEAALGRVRGSALMRDAIAADLRLGPAGNMFDVPIGTTHTAPPSI